MQKKPNVTKAEQENLLPAKNSSVIPYLKKRKRPIAKEPTEIGTLLETYLLSSPFRQATSLLKLNKKLPEILGIYLADKVSLEDLKGGILTLKVPSAVWKAELYAQKKAIIGKANSVLESPIIKDIRFV